jgi:hypothetical protein
MLGAAGETEKPVREAGLAALEALADEKTVPPLVDLALKAPTPEQLAPIEKALGAICAQAKDKVACTDTVARALAKADAPAKAVLLRVLGRTGGPHALDIVRRELANTNADVQNAALRSLADWPDAAAAPALLEFARSTPNETQAAIALRGYIRSAGMQGVADAEKVRMCREALAVAKRPEEPKAALAVLGQVGSLEALKAVEPYLAQKDLKEEASAAALGIARKIPGKPGPEVRAAMAKVAEVSENKVLQNEAAGILKKAE